MNLSNININQINMMKIWIAAHKIRKYTLFGSVLKYFIKSYKIYISILNMTQRNDI